MTTDTGIKFKFETSAKKIDQQLFNLITIDILKLEKQHSSSQYTIILPMNPIINGSFNKHPMSWEIIHCRLLHPYGSITKEKCCHQTLYVLQKHCTKKIHKSPCTICYTSKMTTNSKGTTFDTSNIQPG